jgi:2-hydroxy-3-keto-5-methylthiopentenyl-1-phosphate phosphatase
LFKKYADKNEVWDLFVHYFRTNPESEIPERLVYYLSVIPWHPDLLFYKDSHTIESRDHGKTLIKEFGKDDILKLLHFVDEENMISRGSLGQSVDAIVSAVPDFLKYLEEIIREQTTDIKLREVAGSIFAYHKGAESLETLSIISPEESWYIQEVIAHIKEFGDFDPY